MVWRLWHRLRSLPDGLAELDWEQIERTATFCTLVAVLVIYVVRYG